MKFASRLATLIAALCFAGTAQATTITFEDIGQIDGVVDLSSHPGYQGLNWNSTLDTVDLGTTVFFWSGTGPAHSGRQAVLNNNGGSGVIIGSASSFVFNEVWLKSWFGSADGSLGTITGLLAGNQVFQNSFVVSSAWQDIIAGAQTIDTLIIQTGGIFLIDDLTINGFSASVPAPSALLLLGAGLAVVGRLRRKAR